MVQKILSDKVMNERTNAYYSYYLGERNISVLPLNVYEPPERFIAYIKKNRENLNITLEVYAHQLQEQKSRNDEKIKQMWTECGQNALKPHG